MCKFGGSFIHTCHISVHNENYYLQSICWSVLYSSREMTFCVLTEHPFGHFQVSIVGLFTTKYNNSVSFDRRVKVGGHIGCYLCTLGWHYFIGLSKIKTIDSAQPRNHSIVTRPFSSWEGGVWPQDYSLSWQSSHTNLRSSGCALTQVVYIYLICGAANYIHIHLICGVATTFWRPQHKKLCPTIIVICIPISRSLHLGQSDSYKQLISLVATWFRYR